MKISFIIPAHNAAEYLVRSVHSILDLFQDTVPFEILIVENGSTDNTQELASELAADHDEVLLFHSETGLPQARNVGMRHADGEWICFVDADDLCEPGMVKVISFLETHTFPLIHCVLVTLVFFIFLNSKYMLVSGSLPCFSFCLE